MGSRKDRVKARKKRFEEIAAAEKKKDKTREPITLKKKGDKQTTTGVGKKPIIHLNNQQKDNSLKAQRERLPKTFLGKAAKAITSPKLTGFLTTTLATMGIGAAAGGGAAAAGAGARTAAVKGGQAVITRTATKVGFKKATSLTTQRAFVGKSASNPKLLKLFKNPQIRNINMKYASNAKSQGLTTSFLKKIGYSSGVLLTLIGTYPFAGFIKEESLQTLGFAVRTAEANNDMEGMEKAIAEQEELLDPNKIEKLLNSIPFANVVKQIRNFFDAARIKLEVDKTRFEQMGIEMGEDFVDEFTQSREDARQTQLEQRARDAEYFNLIREGKFDEAQTLLDTELEGGIK